MSDADPDTSDHQYPIDGSAITEAVVLAVSSARGVDPTDLPPLNETLDATALDALWRPTGTGDPVSMDLRFTFAGCRVSVLDAKTVRVVLPREDRSGNVS